MARVLADRLRRAFKALNRVMMLLWRLGLGGLVNVWPAVGGRVMVLTHTGRNTGLRRRSPVDYAIIAGDIYCMAGFGSVSDWYRNVTNLPDKWGRGKRARRLLTDYYVLPLRHRLFMSPYRDLLRL
jgi:hypothetical protein